MESSIDCGTRQTECRHRSWNALIFNNPHLHVYKCYNQRLLVLTLSLPNRKWHQGLYVETTLAVHSRKPGVWPRWGGSAACCTGGSGRTPAAASSGVLSGRPNCSGPSVLWHLLGPFIPQSRLDFSRNSREMHWTCMWRFLFSLRQIWSTISECGYPSKQLGSQAFGLEFRSPEPRYREPQSKLAREFDWRVLPRWIRPAYYNYFASFL